MALADSVSGVSGGTDAFILGFYDRFIRALNTLTSSSSNKKDAQCYLMKLGVGWITIGLLSLLILGIGLSRIYLGVHYTSDVLAGFLVAIIYVILEIQFMKNKSFLD